MNNGEICCLLSACLISATTGRYCHEGHTQGFSRNLIFAAYRSLIIPTLHEINIEHHEFHRKWSNVKINELKCIN
jgi:hypothetical protein